VIPKNATTTTITIYRLSALPPAGGPPEPRIGPIHLDAKASGGPTIDFNLEPDKSYVVIGDTDYSLNGPPSPTNNWRPLSLVFMIDPAGITTTLTATFEQPQLFTQHLVAPPLKAGHTLTMTAGYHADGVFEGELYIDNVVVRITP
jgi:hypothetical protein